MWQSGFLPRHDTEATRSRPGSPDLICPALPSTCSTPVLREHLGPGENPAVPTSLSPTWLLGCCPARLSPCKSMLSEVHLWPAGEDLPGLFLSEVGMHSHTFLETPRPLRALLP